MKEKNNNIESNPKEKNNFFFGIITGVAIIAVVGFFVMMGLYLKQNKNSNPSTPKEVNNGVENKQADQPVSLEGLELKDTDHVRGNKDAKITIVEYSDFQCPYCSSFHTTMQQVIQEYSNDVRWVYRHFPLDSIHPVARKVAEASECAGDQDKFWEYTDQAFANQKSLSLDGLSTIADNIGLNMGEFDSCLSSDKYASKVEADFQEGVSMGVRGTPGSFINGQIIPGAVPFEQIQAAIEKLK